MSCITLRGRWCDIVLNVQAPTEVNASDVKHSFYQELEHILDQFQKHHMIFLGDFNVNVGREEIFKPKIENESLHEIRNDNGVRVVNFATSKNLYGKSTMFPHCNIRKYTSTSPDGKTHSQINHILIDKKAAFKYS